MRILVMAWSLSILLVLVLLASVALFSSPAPRFVHPPITVVCPDPSQVYSEATGECHESRHVKDENPLVRIANDRRAR